MLLFDGVHGNSRPLHFRRVMRRDRSDRFGIDAAGKPGKLGKFQAAVKVPVAEAPWRNRRPGRASKQSVKCCCDCGAAVRGAEAAVLWSN